MNDLRKVITIPKIVIFGIVSTVKQWRYSRIINSSTSKTVFGLYVYHIILILFFLIIHQKFEALFCVLRDFLY
jgi:hypothetical protein